MLSSRTRKGFSLLEVVVAMGAFTLIMLGIMHIMTQSVKSYRAMKTIQRNLEAAQFAINSMAKELRTSTIISSSTGSNASTITFYDYSQNRCIRYIANESSGLIERGSQVFASSDMVQNLVNCASLASSGFGGVSLERLASGLSNQVFVVDKSESSPLHVGRVTMAFTMGTGGSAATAQTTVSLRNYIDPSP